MRELRFPIPHRRESVLELEREDGEFDCVLLLEVMEHMEDYRRAIGELCRVARSKVIISVPNEPLLRTLNFLRGKYVRDWGNTPGHINHFSARSLRRELSAFGEVTSIARLLPWLLATVRPHRRSAGNRLAA